MLFIYGCPTKTFLQEQHKFSQKPKKIFFFDFAKKFYVFLYGSPNYFLSKIMQKDLMKQKRPRTAKRKTFSFCFLLIIMVIFWTQKRSVLTLILLNSVLTSFALNRSLYRKILIKILQ